MEREIDVFNSSIVLSASTSKYGDSAPTFREKNVAK